MHLSFDVAAPAFATSNARASLQGYVIEGIARVVDIAGVVRRCALTTIAEAHLERYEYTLVRTPTSSVTMGKPAGPSY